MKKIIMIILVTVLLFSCDNSEKVNEGLKEKVTNVYKMTPLELTESINTGNNIVIGDESIYVLSTQESKNTIYKIGFDGKIIDSTPIVKDDESTYVNSYNRFNDGRYLVMFQKFDGKAIFTLKIYSESGELLKEIDILSVVNQEIENLYLSYMVTDDANNIYLGGNSYLIVLSENGDKIYEYTFDTRKSISNFGKTLDNKVYVKYNDYSVNLKTCFDIIDIEKKTLNPISIPDKFNTYEYTIFLGPEYDFYIKDTVGLYGYNTETDELILLANWMNSDIPESFVYNLTIISPDCFIFTGYNRIKSINQLNIMNRIPDDEVKAKYIIRMQMDMFRESSLISMVAAQFNLENDEYRIVIDYLKQDENMDYLDWRNSILNGYVSGNIPDIVIVENDMMFQSLMDKGAFVDLYEFLDNDPDINRDSLFNCVKKPFERNGKLYQLFSTFTIQTLTAKTINVKDIKEWNISTAIDFINNLPDGVSFTEFDSLDMMSNIFLIRGFDSFIDYENATCDFDNEDFRKILKLFLDYSVMDYTIYNQMRESGEIINNYRDNKIIVSSSPLSTFSSYLRLKADFNLEDITFIGLPSSDGNGSVINGTSYAISAKSQHKEGAWEFLKYLVSDEILMNDPYSSFFTSTISAFHKFAEREMNMIYSFGVGLGFGGRYRSEDDDEPVNESFDRMSITQEDVDFLVEFFNSDFSVFRYDTSLVNIIYEELMPFIEGMKSVEETAKIIQSRALVYMNENYSK